MSKLGDASWVKRTKANAPSNERTVKPKEEKGFPFSRFHGQEGIVQTSLQGILDGGLFARALKETHSRDLN